jgi:hypothetical protein
LTVVFDGDVGLTSKRDPPLCAAAESSARLSILALNGLICVARA